MCYVVAGEYVFAIRGRHVEAHAGTFVILPRGIFHGFRSTGKEVGKLLTLCLPGGIEDLLDELAHLPNQLAASLATGDARR